MEIKFNCSNPDCNQRIAVDEAWAGHALSCPACATNLRVPLRENPTVAETQASASLPQEIKFNCRNPECQQPIAVDPSQAGHWLKCPKCGKPAHVPGTRLESVTDAVIVEAMPVGVEIIVPIAVVADRLEKGEVAGLWNLVKGWGLGAMILGLLVGILNLHSWVSLPRNLDVTADKVFFHGEILTAPVINHAGTELAYVRTIEGGVGVFLVNLNTLERKQIALAKPADSARDGAVKLFGWSPDDHYLAFSTIQKGKENKNVAVCDGNTGAAINSFESPHSVETGKWLTADSIALIDNNHLLFLLNLETDIQLGQYGNKGFVKLQQLDESGSWLTPDSSRSTISMAYVDKGNVWSFDLSANKLSQLTQLAGAVISSLDYNGDTFSYLFAVKNGSSQDLYQYDRTSELTTLTPTNFFDRGQWIQDGTAYIGTQGNRYYLGVKTKDPVLQTNLFTAPEINKNTGLLNKQLFSEGRDVVRTFSVSPKRDKIYTVASLNYEPLAIWEYDVANKTLRNVVPERENQTAVPVITPVQAYITGTDGRKIDYYYLPPAGFEKGRKYPVVMDQFSDLGFQPNSQFLASAGIIYVAVFPYGVGRPDHPTDPEDTLAVYREMLKNPNVDPKRIYLFGESAGTGIITQLLEEHPELWRGAIMLSPVSFPSLESGKKMCRSIFFSFGEEDDMGSQARMENFVNEACGHLVRTQVEYGRAGHVFFDVAELKKRYKAIATFILTDY